MSPGTPTVLLLTLAASLGAGAACGILETLIEDGSGREWVPGAVADFCPA